MITQFNDQEDSLLQGLPLRAQIIYLRGLRRYMNYKTGIVGNPERRICLKMLGEVAESYNNRQRETPSKKEVIVSLDQLKKVGLIERVEDKDFLIFFLTKADRGQSVSGNYGTTTAQQRHNNGTDHGTDKTSNDEECGGNNGTPKKDIESTHTETTAHIGYTDNGYQDNSIFNNIELEKKQKKTKFQKPTIEQISDHINEKQYSVDAELFFAHYEANGWVVGQAKTPMKCWKSALVTWEKRSSNKNMGVGKQFNQPTKAQAISQRNQETMQRMIEKYGAQNAAD